MIDLLVKDYFFLIHLHLIEPSKEPVNTPMFESQLLIINIFLISLPQVSSLHCACSIISHKVFI